MRKFLLGLLLLGVFGCAKAEPKVNEESASPSENGGKGGESGFGGEGGASGGGNEQGGDAGSGTAGSGEAGSGDAGSGGGNEQGGKAGSGETGGTAGQSSAGGEAGAAGDAGQAGSGGEPPKPCSNKPIINELMTAKESGGKLDEKYEFIELLAVGDDATCEISLLDYEILFGSSVIWSGGASPGFKKGKRFVLGGESFSADGQPLDIGLSESSLQSAGGCVELRKNNALVDRVCYGSGASEAPAPNPGQSVGRSPDGVDTDSDSADFKIFDQPTPKAKNP